jgi:nitric oxide reductase large subunit
MLPLLRIVALLLGLGVIGTAALWVLTRERKWLGRSLLLLKIAVATGFVFFGVLIFERLR